MQQELNEFLAAEAVYEEALKEEKPPGNEEMHSELPKEPENMIDRFLNHTCHPTLSTLGVTIDNKLNFNEHINDVCNKASQRVGVIMRLRNLIPTTAKLVLFKSAILPYLTYCHLVWHFCRASDTRRLERIQERGLTAVYKDTKSGYHQLLNRANLPT